MLSRGSRYWRAFSSARRLVLASPVIQARSRLSSSGSCSSVIKPSQHYSMLQFACTLISGQLRRSLSLVSTPPRSPSSPLSILPLAQAFEPRELQPVFARKRKERKKYVCHAWCCPREEERWFCTLALAESCNLRDLSCVLQSFMKTPFGRSHLCT